MYYEEKRKQFSKDCHQLNDALGNAIDSVEDDFKGYHKNAITQEIVPVVLANLLVRHFKHFFYDEPQDIINFLNYLKKMLVEECDDRDELDMVDSIEYGNEVLS